MSITSSASPPATGSNIRTCFPLFTSQTRLARPPGLEEFQRIHLRVHINHDQCCASRDRIMDAHLFHNHKQPEARPSPDPQTLPSKKPQPRSDTAPPHPPPSGPSAARPRAAACSRLASNRRPGVARPTPHPPEVQAAATTVLRGNPRDSKFRDNTKESDNSSVSWP